MNQAETHVYIAELKNYPLPALTEIKAQLPESEFAQTQTFVTEALRQNALRTKLLTRTILAQYLNLTPKQVPIIRQNLEKPKLAAPYENFNFNISHTKTYFALAITLDALIGIDVENIDKKTDILGIAQRFFHPDEYQALVNCKNKQETFFRIWTQKEALVKALGEGLSFGLEKFSVDPKEAKILSLEHPLYKAQEFYSQLLELPLHHYLCITSTKDLKHLKIFN